MNLKVKSLLLAFLLIILSPSPIIAKKKLVRKTPPAQIIFHPHDVWSKPKLREDRKAVLVIFGGMQYADSLNYNLTYTADSIPQGIQGFHDPQKGNTQTEMLFGTCSNSDCTYDEDIEDMLLEIIFGLKSGQTLTQRYQINP